MFCENDYECQIQMTTVETGADKIAEKYAKNKDLVVCIGGDGTFNELVTGIVKNNYTCNVGYIPSGSTNDFAGGIGISVNPVKAAKDIINGKCKKIDVGMFNDRIFTYTAAFGAFTKTSYNTPRDLKNSLGHLAYVLEGIKDLASVKSRHLKIEFDDKIIEDDYIFAAICNSTSVGGVLTINPDFVNLNDGLFELLLVKMPKNLIEMNSVIIALNSMDYSNDLITFNSVSSAKIYSLDDNDWSIDGEYMKGCKHIEMTAISDAIKIIVPRD